MYVHIILYNRTISRLAQCILCIREVLHVYYTSRLKCQKVELAQKESWLDWDGLYTQLPFENALACVLYFQDMVLDCGANPHWPFTSEELREQGSTCTVESNMHTTSTFSPLFPPQTRAQHTYTQTDGGKLRRWCCGSLCFSYSMVGLHTVDQALPYAVLPHKIQCTDTWVYTQVGVYNVSATCTSVHIDTCVNTDC